LEKKISLFGPFVSIAPFAERKIFQGDFSLSKRNIYLVQVDTIRRSLSFMTAYLPYAVGQLWAYAQTSPHVSEAYTLKDLLFLREKTDSVVSAMEDPFLVAFSCYIWNTEYNKSLAEEIKRKFPDCKILFGGHNVPPDNSFLREFPYIDFLSRGEGEIPFQRLLTELLQETPDLSAVPGLAYRLYGNKFAENAPQALSLLSDIPSPYLIGVFDSLVQQHPELQWCCVWETNRGCPYNCAYCDWGLLKSKIRCFSMKRLLAELKWFGNNKVEFIWGADANFGVFARDEELIDAFVAQYKDMGYPFLFKVNYAKNDDDRVFRIIQKLNMLSEFGATISFQSLNPKVLKNVGRTNTDLNRFRANMRRYHEAGIKTYSELILGLPDETLQSFCDGVATLLDNGQHNGIECYSCHLLPNSRLATPEVRKKFNIQAVRQKFIINLEDKTDANMADIPEYVDIVLSTDSMSHTERLLAILFMTLIKSMHEFGLLRFFAIFLHVSHSVLYQDFYMELLHFAQNNSQTLLGETLAYILNYHESVIEDIEVQPLDIKGVLTRNTNESFFCFGRATLEIDRFYQEACSFLKQYNMSTDIFNELLHYQQESIQQPHVPQKQLSFHFDFPAFFAAAYTDNPIPLQKRDITLIFGDEENPKSWSEYGESVIFRGRFTDRSFYKISYLKDEINGQT
jgi:putative methyltransferase